MLVGQDVYVLGFDKSIRYYGTIESITDVDTFEVKIKRVMTPKETKRREGLSIAFAAKWVICMNHSWYVKSGMLTDLMICKQCGKEERYK